MGIEQFIAKVAVQTAVYWANPVADGYGGTTYDYPIEISCRWEDSTRKVMDANGDEIVSRAQILLTRDVDEGGVLFLGDLDDLVTALLLEIGDFLLLETGDYILRESSEEVNPKLMADAYEIVRFDKIPMIKKTDEFVRTAYL